MISKVLTFTSNINVSLQVGDVVYYSPTGSAGSFHTVNNINTIVTFGIVTSIPGYTSGSSGTPLYSIIVIYDETNPDTPPPAPGDYIMFAKNKEVNSSSLKGYFAKIKLVNYSADKVELFSVGSEVSESSK